MAPHSRRRRWAGLILATLVVGAGCNPLTSLYFLWPNSDDGIAPECKLSSKDPEKESRVVILAYSSLETRPEFLRVDRELANLLLTKLQTTYKEKKEKVVLVPISKVEKFKDEHPNWKSLSPQEIGEHFHADFVIDLSIESMSLYEPGSRLTLYHGNAEVTVNVINVHNADEGPTFHKPFTCEYPKSKPIPVDFASSNSSQFRQAFLDRLATELSWMFVSHPYEDTHFQMD